MNRKQTVATMVLIVFVMAFMAFRMTSLEVPETQSASVDLSSQPVVTASTAPTPTPPPPANPVDLAAPSQTQSSETTRQVQLQQKEQIINDLSSRLAQLEDQAEVLVGDASSAAQRQSLMNQRQDLSFSLQDLYKQEEEIHRRAQDALNNQSSLSQMTYQDLDRRIQERTQGINQIQNEIGAASLDRGYYDQQQLRLTELNSQLLEQTQDLDALRQQRLNLANEIISGKQAIQEQREAALDQLQQERSNLQSQSQSLAEEINQSQRQNIQKRSDLIRLQQEIRQTRTSLQNEQQELRNLENAATE